MGFIKDKDKQYNVKKMLLQYLHETVAMCDIVCCVWLNLSKQIKQIYSLCVFSRLSDSMNL